MGETLAESNSELEMQGSGLLLNFNLYLCSMEAAHRFLYGGGRTTCCSGLMVRIEGETRFDSVVASSSCDGNVGTAPEIYDIIKTLTSHGRRRRSDQINGQR
ncbi:hypothetical protein GWI33_001812 [Rhynchophorus ferrugineus]|uniref:Uncharacterized protein n=1 Tax=Rhynchophorus ferrugineus TaxID=354439 RepID=A0A834IRV1_RHYFE|nr:hypothetical protein GWI33_001812 [Rhynchophorus ferrugineus]